MSHQADLGLPPPIAQQESFAKQDAFEPYTARESTPSSTELPTTHTNGGAATNGDLKNNLINSAKSTMASINNHPTTQSAKDTIVNGPVGQTVQDQGVKTSNEFKDLANSRQTPDAPAATGQPLTHYHSMFYRLLSWKSPRATGITFATTIILIFAARYLNILRYTFKGLYLILGVTAAAEIAGKTILGDGIATRMRPKKYFVIPKESLERFLDDAEQLINFFVIEFQRIVFVENVWATLLAFTSSFISYFLIKFVPFWGLTLIADVFLFLAPLIYLQNKEFIDAQLNHAKNVASAQATQVRNVAAEQTSRTTESLKGYTNEYTKKAQDLIGQGKAKAQSATSPSSQTSGLQANDLPSAPKVHTSDFPAAPREEPIARADEPAPVPAAY